MPLTLRQTVFLILCLSQFTLGPSWSAPVLRETKPYRVLVLNSYHKGMKWEDSITEGLIAELNKSSLNIEILIEYLDTKRYAKQRLFPHLASLYAAKYSSQPDVIILADDNALDFVLTYRDTLFPEVPVVFSGINDEKKAYRSHALGFTGLTENIAMKRTLELMLQLHPKAKRVMAIVDSVPSAAFHLEDYYKAASAFPQNIEFSVLNNWTFGELKEALATLPEDTILLYLSIYRDRDGVSTRASGGHLFLTQHTSLPVYTLWEDGLGSGMIGGFVVDGRLHGKLAAEMVVRILKGESVHTIPILGYKGFSPMFDYRALQTHNISLAELPKQSIVLNEPQSFYYKYFPYVWMTIAFLLFQSGIIIVLLYLVNSSRQRERDTMLRANAKLESRVEARTQELRQRTLELERINNDLDQFTYVASHDLQEPVRNLVSYSTLLQEDLGEVVSESVAEDLFYITSAATRMQTLVQDLLVLSRAGRNVVKVETVALDDCVDHALEALRIRIDETQADIQRESLPNVTGDRTLLNQLYQNLLGNALKFTGEKRPVIRVTAQRQGTGYVFGVHDNGIGLEEEYAELIFKPFKRLHGLAEYDGTGIGLSICQKAVERHGGRIWVESQPGHGAHFFFTLALSAVESEHNPAPEEAWRLQPAI